MLPQHLKSTLLRHAKKSIALLMALLALLLYLTTRLSTTTMLSGTLIDIAIYTIYILLIMVLTAILFIAYCYFEEENICDLESDTTDGDIPEIEPLLSYRPAASVAQPVREKADDIRSELTAARERLLPSSMSPRQGLAAVEAMESDRLAAYLHEQHSAVMAAVLLLIDPEKAVAVLEQIPSSGLIQWRHEIRESRPLSRKAVMMLLNALQAEFREAEDAPSLLEVLTSDEIRSILRQVTKKELMFALKGAGQELQEKFFANMSSKASAEFRAALASLSQIDAGIQQNALRNLGLLAQRLRDNGKIRVKTR